MKRLPWRLYFYFGRELVLTFALGLLALTLLYSVITGLKGVSLGLASSVIIAWLVESIGFSLFFTVPISLLVAGALAYGRVSADREFTAVTAAGLSPLHLGVPMGALSLILGTLALATHGWVLPDAHYAQRNVARFLRKQLENLGDRKEGQLPLNEEDGHLLFEEARNGTYLKNVQLVTRINGKLLEQTESEGELALDQEQDDREARVPFILEAKTAEIRVDEDEAKIYLDFRGVTIKVNDPDGDSPVPDLGWTQKWYGGIELPTLEVAFSLEAKRKREGDLRNDALLAQIEEFDVKAAETATIDTDKGREEAAYWERKSRQYRAEFWRRKALAMSIFTFGFLGFPIALALRYKHRLVSLFVSAMIVVVVFYPLLLLGETLAISLGISPLASMMFGNAAITLIAAYFTGRLLVR